MVGFKSIWPLLTLLLFAACVPQTKQTECKSNEAFNATLRTCVPVVPGTDSFININSFLPTQSLTKYKNDTTPITFSITVSNPYAQPYSIQWERIYNGVPIPIAPAIPTAHTFAPSLLFSEVGTHIISVKILNANNVIVDSHSFELKINDNPKPVIQSATVTPPLYASTYTPSSLPQNFAFTVYNNGATMAGAGYRTDWKLYRSGVLIDSETDVFPTAAPSGSLSSTGYNYPVYTFNPILIDGIAIGAYTVNARVTNSANEVVAEQQWSASVTHPPLAQITNRDIYSGSSSPAFAAVTTAYNNVAYTGSPTYNFVPTGGVAQGDYCVAVSNGEGTYVGDGLFVRVDYYLDGGTLVYSNLTTAVDNKVCLSDAAVGTLNSVIFSNASATSTQSHTLVARVVDEGTGAEYTAGDMNASLGSYPITWNFSVKPQNQAPTVSFGTMTGVTCTTTSGSSKSGCTVTSDTNFTVKINLTADDFYTLPANEANFNYSVRLYQDGVSIQTCTKASPGADLNGADGYDCVFNIPSYNGSGSFDTKAKVYQIQAEINDTGSPITATPATSSTLYWNFALGSVLEKRTAPTVSSWSVSGAVTEGNNITFSADISDPELDNHTYVIKYCTNVGCTTTVDLTSGTITRTSTTNPYSFSASYNLPQDFLLGIAAPSPLNCNTKKRGETCAVDFKMVVTDIQNSAGALPAASSPVTTSTVSSVITNFNPLPSVNTATLSSPLPSTVSAATTITFVGHPFSIVNPSNFVSDPSTVAAEKNFRYQWFIKNNNSVNDWQAIEGAIGMNLVWTPSLIKEANVATDNPFTIMICVEDQPIAAVASVNIFDSTCNTDPGEYWTLTVKNNIATAYDLSTTPSSTELAISGSDLGTETAIWYETPSVANSVTSSASYIAMIGNDKRIHVKKVLVRKEGGIDTTSYTSIVSFDAFPGGVVASQVKDLSITGYESLGVAKDLYIAYLASKTGAPLSLYPQVRRIDLKSNNRIRSVPNNHFGKFGFDYDGLGVTNSCAPASDCPTTAASGVTSIGFANSGATGGTFVFNTGAGNFTINFGTSNGTDTVCSNCSSSVVAAQVANIINSSINPLLAGYSAEASGATVDIYGSAGLDYIDSSTLVANSRMADRLGKIYVTSAGWFLPFIDTTLGGSFNGKISMYSGNSGALVPANVAFNDAIGSTGLDAMDAAVKFDNYYDGSNLWIAMVSKTASVGKLYKFASNNFTALPGSSNSSLFSGDALIDIQVASSSSYTYVTAKKYLTPTTYKNRVGIYDNNASIESQFDIDDPASIEAGTDTDDIFNHTSLASYRILAYGTEARIVAVSKGITSDYKLYIGRLRKVSSTWTLSCGDCKPVSNLGVPTFNYVSSNVTLGVAPIRDNPTSDYRLSTDGALSNTGEGLKDVLFVSFGRTDSNTTPTSCDPAIGVFNVEGEAINSTTIFDGTTFSGTTPSDVGLYRPPFIKN